MQELDKHQNSDETSIEQIVLIALMMSLVALTIDMVLPALAIIAADFGVENDNQRQYIISAVFLGLTGGQLIYGPISDSIGRKPAISIGFIIFLVGSTLAIFSNEMSLMLWGRFFQGIGAAAMRIVLVAMIRDEKGGIAMARILSLSMSVFILIPCVAPLMGQGVLAISDWRSIFYVLFLVAVILWLWFLLRQPETLKHESRVSINIPSLWARFKRVLSYNSSVKYTMALGIIQGAFIGYLVSAQQIMHDIYKVGDMFALYFAVIAFGMGISYFLNARLVTKYGLERLISRAVVFVLVISSTLVVLSIFIEGQPPLSVFLISMSLLLFAMGFTLGNLNALSMEPMNDLAGIASSVLGVLAGVVAIVFGWLIGYLYNGTLIPLASGFSIAAICALFLIRNQTQPE